ncbi:MAG: hypothetical protein QMD95_00370, partial [Candidatus Hodarchaeaceae archaeon]|nr:hypothetical protein [Candidatus Hodarchaeaceae archaeon]
MGRLIRKREICVRLVSLSLVFMFLLTSSPLAFAGRGKRDYIQYVIELEGPTIIEGNIVDNETGASVSGARV